MRDLFLCSLNISAKTKREIHYLNGFFSSKFILKYACGGSDFFWNQWKTRALELRVAN